MTNVQELEVIELIDKLKEMASEIDGLEEKLGIDLNAEHAIDRAYGGIYALISALENAE